MDDLTQFHLRGVFQATSFPAEPSQVDKKHTILHLSPLIRIFLLRLECVSSLFLFFFFFKEFLREKKEREVNSIEIVVINNEFIYN